MIKEGATRHLNNFLTSYNLQESTEMLSQVYNHIEGVHFSAMDNGKKEQVLDFLEALEELLPAVHELY